MPTMEGQHLGQDEFFDRLGKLFERRKGSDHGAIYLTQKRLAHGLDAGAAPPPDKQQPDGGSPAPAPAPVLIRASDGRAKARRADKVKLSVVVQPHELEAFFGRYAEVCKAGMAALKPRDRSKKKAKARKKKAAA